MKTAPLFLALLLSAQAHSASIEIVDVYSRAMQKPVRCMVIKPGAYARAEKPHAVLYLLHGWSGDFSSWLSDAPQLLDWADRKNMIFVCPDGGFDSWYIDSPVDTGIRYETFVAVELVQFVDNHYATLADPSGRFIAGLSMGGHGALYLSLRHPATYSAAASLAGGLDLRPFRKNDWQLERILGNPRNHWENWENASVSFLLEKTGGAAARWMIDCGMADFFLPVNRDVHEKLVSMNIPHVYNERPGGHEPAYWSQAIDDVLAWLPE